jgi:hypothetical protein
MVFMSCDKQGKKKAVTSHRTPKLGVGREKAPRSSGNRFANIVAGTLSFVEL